MSDITKTTENAKTKSGYSAAEKRRIKALEKKISEYIDSLNIDFAALAAFNSDEDTYNERPAPIAYLRYSSENQL